MNEENRIGTYQFVAEPFHVDFNGRLTMGVLGNHLLNCAGFHANDRGFGIATLNEDNYTWVLSRLAIELDEMPYQYENFSVQTWVENVYRLFTDRNFAIIDKDGKKIGYARSVWAMINLNTRKPADLLTLHGGSIVTETVVIRDEFPLEKAREVLENETIAVIGYGVQGPGQALNLRDNGFNVIVGQREGKTYDKAVADGWVPGETLFGIEEACEKGTIVMCLLSDAAVMSVWPTIKPYLTAGKALYFSHGFAITWNDRTGVVPPADIDVIMVAPKGSGTSLRTMFLEGRGLNSSYAIYQDATGKAYERTIALGIGIGSGYLFETTFQREATSDLTGERGSLMGAIQGLLLAQYEVLRENGHSPSEAFNEKVLKEGEGFLLSPFFINKIFKMGR